MLTPRKALFEKLVSYSLAALFTVALFEICAAFLLNHPELLRLKRNNLLRSYYIGQDRRIIQYQPDCARYDADLGYTLKPGECRFRNREFDTEYRINSMGVRDDEASLASPEVVVLGDSYAMGWGVEQDETFAQLIEKNTGMKVLNTAVSSYGTARELKTLKRVPLDKVRYLVIQYCRNDYEENKALLEHDNHLPVLSEADYDKTVKKAERKQRYYFGKHSLNLTGSLAKSLKRLVKPATPKASAAYRQEETAAFVNALLHSPVDLSRLTIIVLEINALGDNDGQFITKLNESMATKSFPQLRTLDLSNTLTPDNYYVLDDHLNARGHQTVANRLIELMNRK